MKCIEEKKWIGNNIMLLWQKCFYSYNSLSLATYLTVDKSVAIVVNMHVLSDTYILGSLSNHDGYGSENVI